MRMSRRRSAKVEEIRSDETKRKRSGHFAIISFVLDVIGIACVMGGVWLFTYGISADAWTTLTILALLPIGVAFALFAGALAVFGFALVMVITQFAINRSAWSWIALAMLIVSFVGVVIVALLVLNNLPSVS